MLAGISPRRWAEPSGAGTAQCLELRHQEGSQWPQACVVPAEELALVHPFAACVGTHTHLAISPWGCVRDPLSCAVSAGPAVQSHRQGVLERWLGGPGPLPPFLGAACALPLNHSGAEMLRWGVFTGFPGTEDALFVWDPQELDKQEPQKGGKEVSCPPSAPRRQGGLLHRAAG